MKTPTLKMYSFEKKKKKTFKFLLNHEVIAIGYVYFSPEADENSS